VRTLRYDESQSEGCSENKDKANAGREDGIVERKTTPRHTPVAEGGSHFFPCRIDCSKRPEAVATTGVRQRDKELGGLGEARRRQSHGTAAHGSCWVQAARLRERLLAAGALLFWEAHCFACASTI
jgi:hypothetical protein